MTNPEIPTPSGIRRGPYDRKKLLNQANTFLESSPLGALNIAKAILGYEPDLIEGWILLFHAALKINKKKKVFFWTPIFELLTAKLKKIRNLKNAIEIMAAHPTNISLWKQVCKPATNANDPHLEEMVRRIIFECDRKNAQSMEELAEFLCRKGQLLADEKEKLACFSDAVYLLEKACLINKTDYGMTKKLRDAYALSAACGWEKVQEEGGSYRGLIVTEKWPKVT